VLGALLRLPGRALRDLNGLLPLLLRGQLAAERTLGPSRDGKPDRSQGPVLDLREEQRIIPSPLLGMSNTRPLQQQIRVLCIEWHIFQVE